jgi:hypothetical protein
MSGTEAGGLVDRRMLVSCSFLVQRPPRRRLARSGGHRCRRLPLSQLGRYRVCGYVLLKLGRADQARHVLTAALGGIGPAAVKQRAVFLFDIATTYLTISEPDVDHASQLAGDAAASLATAVDRLTASVRKYARGTLAPLSVTSTTDWPS